MCETHKTVSNWIHDIIQWFCLSNKLSNLNKKRLQHSDHNEFIYSRKKNQYTTNIRISYSENDLCHNKHIFKFEMLWHASYLWIFFVHKKNCRLSHEISDS